MVWLCLAWACRADRDVLQSLRISLQRAREQGGDARLRRIESALQVLVDTAREGTVHPESWRLLFEGLGEGEGDALGAQAVVGTLARVPAALWPADHAAAVQRTGLRFCISRGATETLAGLARPQADLEALVRQCHADISALAERAVEESLHGDPLAAAQRLLESGEKTLNTRLIETAAVIARRHAERAEGLSALAGRCEALLARLADATNGLPASRRFGPAAR